jgi:cell filamentation protein
MTNRYETSYLVEGRFQEESNESVLKNELGIIDSNEMDEIELGLLVQLTDTVIDDITLDKTLTANDLSEWHAVGWECV